MTDTTDQSLIAAYIAAHDSALFPDGAVADPIDIDARRVLLITAHATATLAMLVALGLVAAS